MIYLDFCQGKNENSRCFQREYSSYALAASFDELWDSRAT